MKDDNRKYSSVQAEEGAAVYGSIFNHAGYSIQFNSVFEEKALFFDGRAPAAKISFEAGTLDKGDASFTPGTLIVNESGTYVIEYTVNVFSNMEAQCRAVVYADHALLLNSMTLLQVHPENMYLFTRRTCYTLNAGCRLQLILCASESGSLLIGGNLSELSIEKLSD